jgi:hypothetical protein
MNYNPRKPGMMMSPFSSASSASHAVPASSSSPHAVAPAARRRAGFRRHQQIDPFQYSHSRAQEFLNMQADFATTNTDSKPYNMIFHNTIVSLKSNILHAKATLYSSLQKEKVESEAILNHLLGLARELEEINMEFHFILEANTVDNVDTNNNNAKIQIEEFYKPQIGTIREKENYWKEPWTKEYLFSQDRIEATIKIKIQQWTKKIQPLLGLYSQMQKIKRGGYQYAQTTPNYHAAYQKIHRTILQKHRDLIDELPIIKEQMKATDDYLNQVHHLLKKCATEFAKLKQNRNLFAIGPRVRDSIRNNYIALNLDHRYFKRFNEHVIHFKKEIGRMNVLLHKMLPKEIHQNLKSNVQRHYQQQIDHADDNMLVQNIKAHVGTRRNLDQQSNRLIQLQQKEKRLQRQVQQLKKNNQQLRRVVQQISKKLPS